MNDDTSHQPPATTVRETRKRNAKPWKTTLMDWTRRVILFAAMVYLLILAALIWFETDLVYPGAPPIDQQYVVDFEVEDVEFSSADGTRLHGWFVPYAAVAVAPESTMSNRYLLHCHGNAENVSGVGKHVGRAMAKALKANLFVFDYRGFGKSEGRPSERGVREDSEAALQWLTNRFGINAGDIVVDGFSLGGGPAVDLATNHPVAGLILQRTYSSLPDVAAPRYPIFPVRLIMQNRFESAKKLPNYFGPLLMSHGEQDQVIPYWSGQKLFASCGSPDKTFCGEAEMDHFAPLPEDFLAVVAEFGDRVYPESDVDDADE